MRRMNLWMVAHSPSREARQLKAACSLGQASLLPCSVTEACGLQVSRQYMHYQGKPYPPTTHVTVAPFHAAACPQFGHTVAACPVPQKGCVLLATAMSDGFPRPSKPCAHVSSPGLAAEMWACLAGEKWHYAPMATRLAQCGILTCVVSYTLYPQAKARDMVAELSQALSWTLDNIQGYGGNPDQVQSTKQTSYCDALCNSMERVDHSLPQCTFEAK